MLPKWLDEFYGRDLSLYELEVRTIQHVPRSQMRDEAALLNTKWFDYVRMHPTKATYYFVACYDKAYGDFVRQALDMSKGRMKSFKGKDFLEHRDKMAYWKLRKLCDRFGVRYDFFMREAMNWCAQRRFKYAPRPNQILSNEALITDVMLLWEEELSNSLQIPKDDWFRTQRFAGCPNQIRFEDFAISQVKSRRYPHFSLSAALYIYDAIRIERAVEEFGEQAVRKAIDASCLLALTS